MLINGEQGKEPKRLPTIAVGWDAERQVAVVRFDDAEFKTFDFAEAVLRIAADSVKFLGNIGKAAAVQQHQAQQIQAAQIRRSTGL